MGLIKKLASQTVVYGISSMLGRFINFLLVIPHTEYLHSVGAYGDITTIFAFMAFLNIILSYGMETTYFNFIRNGNEANQVYAISQKSILLSTSVFTAFVLLFASQSAVFIGFPDHIEYVYICLIFLVFDTISILPYARLRFEEKPLKFAFVKLVNIGTNVSLNLYLLIKTPDFLQDYSQVTLILIANALASISSFLILSPMAFDIKKVFDSKLYKQMLTYAWPLIFVGLAGIVNETLDRTLLKRMLPEEIGSYQNGIYGAFYKLTMIMTMFVQAFRFAADPLFFKQKESFENRQLYARVMYWFIGVCSFIFLSCMFFIEELSHLFIRNDAFFSDPNGLYIVPILLLANLFLGIYYNLSIWYRFTNNTKIGALISVTAAIITIVLNVIYIPRYGFVSCAWITLGVYAFMTLVSYILGKIYYPIPYHVNRYLLIIGMSIILWLISKQIICHISVKWIEILVNISFLSLLLLIIWILQPKQKIA